MYERTYLTYIVPAAEHRYTPDFILPNGIIIEAKGLFETADRLKHLRIKKQYPHLDIRFIFQNPNNKIYQGSRTTYAQWCTKHGYHYATKIIPASWFKEAHKSLEGIMDKEK